MLLKEIKTVKKPKEVVRDYYGKPLRGLKKDIALSRRKEDVKFNDYEIRDNMVGAAKVMPRVSEAEVETKTAEDLWSENTAKEYRSANQYVVRQIKDSSPAKFEAFSIVGDQRKAFGTFSALDLRKALTPLRANQKPDVEGFTTYVDPEKVQAFQYKGETIKLDLDGGMQQLTDGDYVVRTVDGAKFVFSIENEADFESTLTAV